jgi:hypothetical protein
MDRRPVREDDGAAVTQCKEEVREPGMWPRWHQCTRKATVGEYCRIHSPEAVAQREKAREQHYNEQRARDMAPYAVARIKAVLAKYDNPTPEQRKLIEELRDALKILEPINV